MPEDENPEYCPMCDKGYPTMALLKAHLKKALIEGDENHFDIVEMEGWDESPMSPQ